MDARIKSMNVKTVLLQSGYRKVRYLGIPCDQLSMNDIIYLINIVGIK